MDADVHVCRGPYLRKSEVLNIVALRSLDSLALLHTDLISAFFLDSWEIPNSYVQTGHIIDFSAPTTTQGLAVQIVFPLFSHQNGSLRNYLQSFLRQFR